MAVDDLSLAKAEVVAVIEHRLDIRDYIDMGLDKRALIVATST